MEPFVERLYVHAPRSDLNLKSGDDNACQVIAISITSEERSFLDIAYTRTIVLKMYRRIMGRFNDTE